MENTNSLDYRLKEIYDVLAMLKIATVRGIKLTKEQEGRYLNAFKYLGSVQVDLEAFSDMPI